MDLGQPIPSDPHAVSVSLPLWEHVKGYEEGVPSVINAMKLGYPRFVYHPQIRQLFAEAEKKFANENEFCIVLPSERVAKLCANYCLGEKGMEHGAWKINILQSPISNLHALTLPKGLEKKAKEFWMHTGLIVSSRRAEAALENGEWRMENREKSQSPISNLQSPKQIVKAKLAALSGASETDIYLFPSGMGAIFTAYKITSLRASAKQSPEIATSPLAPRNDSYTLQLGFPYVDTLKIQEKFGKAKFLNYKSAEDLSALEAELKTGNISAVITEFPLNPLLTCVELDEVSRLCRQYGAAFIVDDTLATWENVDVLKYADIAVTSLTKFFSGVGDVLAGSLILNKNSPLYTQLKSKLDGVYEDLLFDADAEVLAKNCVDFEDRIEHINQNAEKFYYELQKLPNVKKVYYTKDDPVYKKYKKPGAGYGGVISVVFETEEQAREYFNNLDCRKGPSLGTNYTLACPYTMLAHYYERDFAEKAGVPFHLIRFSVGVD